MIIWLAATLCNASTSLTWPRLLKGETLRMDEGIFDPGLSWSRGR
jgi:hypothetical protein